MRGDGEWSLRGGNTLKGGAGVSYEHIDVREIEWLPLGWSVGGDYPTTGLDTLGSIKAWAPGAFSYVQGRWVNGGMVVNGRLRAEYWTPGPQAAAQTLPGSSRGVLSPSPRVGIAYPVSVRDVFSLLGCSAPNLFNHLNERAATVDGFPNILVNTIYDDYGAYRTQTGEGGAYLSRTGFGDPVWVPVHDAHLYDAPRAV